MAGGEAGGFLDREALLGGAPAKRAATLLFLIETRTTRLVAQDKQRLVRSLTEESAQERALALLETFALARETAVETSVHYLERQADNWAALVPSNPRLQAALARRFGEKYRFTDRVAPGIRKALGLDSAEVRDAFQTLYGEPVESAFAARLTPGERVRWAWTGLAKRLEHLPPFWTAYSLTLTETVGASLLALPLAVAALGPLPGVALLFVLGLVNMLTVSLIAESVVRSGPMRYKNAFFGRLVEGYLGKRGSLPVSILLAASSFFGIQMYYLGVGTTLEDATSVPAAVWVAVLYVATLLYLWRGSLDATYATALAIGAVNLVLILGLSCLALAHLRGANLLHQEIPFLHGQPFEASALAVVFGVGLMAFFGHLSAVTCGSLVLERDPSGRSLIRGCACAQATAIAVYSVFVLVTYGAVGDRGLSGVEGTAIVPLAHVAGVGVVVLGSAYVILALGIGCLLDGLSLSWLTQERLPLRTPRIVVLPRRRARLVFRKRGNTMLAGLTYLGGSRFAIDLDRSDDIEHTELFVAVRAEVLRAGRDRVLLEVLDADERWARIAVTSTLRMGYEGELESSGLDFAELLSLSDAEAALTSALARSGEASAATVAQLVGQSDDETRAMLEALASRGLAEARPTPTGMLFAVRMAPRRARSSNVWDALAHEPERALPDARVGTRIEPIGGGWPPALGEKGRFVVSVVPLTVACALAEWFVISGHGSFTGILGFVGVIVVSLLAGLYPILLLVSSRRKGEYAPGTVHGFLGKPALLVTVFVIFLSVLVLHGAVIWSDPAERVGAFVAALAMAAIPVVLVRSGAFARRVTVEVRDDERSGTAHFALLSAERPVSGEISLEYGGRELRPEASAGAIPDFDSLRCVRFRVRPDRQEPTDEVKVWAHRVTPDSESESLPATARVRIGPEIHAADLSLARGEAILPSVEPETEIVIALRESEH
jgi:amino acid permease